MERDYQNAMERHKANIEGLMQDMEAGLVAESIPFYMLRRRWSKAKSIWKQYVEQFDLLWSVTHKDPDEQDRVDFNNFQECYTNLHERVGRS